MTAATLEIQRPTRIQRRRVKGWRMPANTVSVTRPGPFGNPYAAGSREQNVQAYRELLTMADDSMAEFRQRIRDQLRGKNLACYCPPGQPCHADVLLELANAPDDQPNQRTTEPPAQHFQIESARQLHAINGRSISGKGAE